MTVSFEILLALGVVGFYLVDSAMLLYTNELVYLHVKGRWRFVSTLSRFQLLGRYFYLPNLLIPESALFRVCWSATAAEAKQEKNNEPLLQLLAAVDSLRHLLRLLWVLMIVGLPLTLIVAGTGKVFLIILGLSYATIVALLMQIYQQRAVLQLSTRAIAKLAFDSLACAPLALNMIRKITMQHALTSDPVSFAKARFDSATFSHLAETLIQWISRELEYEDEASQRYRELSGYKNILARMAS